MKKFLIIVFASFALSAIGCVANKAKESGDLLPSDVDSLSSEISSSINKYHISFLNYDDTPLYQTDVDEGVLPVYQGETPTKPSTNTINYVFDGWEPSLAVASKDETYVAKYLEETRKYTVTLLNEGQEYKKLFLEYDTKIENVDNPTHSSSVSGQYTFVGWKDNAGNVIDFSTYQVKSDLILTASYEYQTNVYTITFLNYDDEVLDVVEVEHGTIPACRVNPEKPSTTEYQYVFDGWDKALVMATENATYKATFTQQIRNYDISFYDDNNVLIEKKSVPYNSAPSITQPTKQPSKQYSYTFIGWATSEDGEVIYPKEVDLPVASEDTSYYARFDTSMNSYQITFREIDGTLLDQNNFNYGSDPVYAGVRQKVVGELTYTIDGWYKNEDQTIILEELPVVEEETTYYAHYSTEINHYTVTFVDSNGTTVLDSNDYEYGQVPSYNGLSTPTKEDTVQYSYTFDGWSKTLDGDKLDNLPMVSGDVTYYPHFASTVKEYAITFLNYDDSPLGVEMVPYGTIPTYKGTPTKPSSIQYDYTFKSWDSPLVAVTGPATYKATYDEVLRSYTVNFYNYDNSLIEAHNFDYGVLPTCSATPQKPDTSTVVYQFTGWSLTQSGEITSLLPVNGNTSYFAKYQEIEKCIIITGGSSTLKYNQSMTLHGDIQGIASDTIDWTTSTPSLCQVTSAGVVTGIGLGNATVTATLHNNNHISASFNFEVVPPDPTSVTIAGLIDGGIYAIGDEVDATATIDPSLASQDVNWSSNNANVSINNSGHALFVSSGSSVITAAASAKNTVQSSVSINVVDPTSTIVLSNANIANNLSSNFNTAELNYSTFSHTFAYYLAKRDSNAHMVMTANGYLRSDLINGFASVTIQYSGSGTLIVYAGYLQAEEREYLVSNNIQLNVEGNYLMIKCTSGTVTIEKVTINLTNAKKAVMNTAYYASEWDYSNILATNPSFTNRALGGGEDANAIHSYAVFNSIYSQYYVAEATVAFSDYSSTDTWSRAGIGIFDDNNSWHGLVVSPGINGNAKKTVVVDADVYGNIYNWQDGTTDRSQIRWGHDINYKIFNQTIDAVNNSYKTPFKLTFVRNGNDYYYFVNDILWWKEEIYLNYDGVATKAALFLGEAQATITNISSRQGQNLVNQFLLSKGVESNKKLYSFYEYSTLVSDDNKTITFTGNYDSFKNNAAYSIGDAYRFDSGFEGSIEFDFRVTGYDSSASVVHYSGSMDDLDNVIGVSFIRYDHANDGTKTCLISQKHMGFTGWNKNYDLPSGIGAWDPIGKTLDFTGATTYHVKIERLIDSSGRDDYRLTLYEGEMVLHSKTWGWYDYNNDPCPVTIAFHAKGITGVLSNVTKTQSPTRKVALKPAQVVLLMGQSNMEGHSHTSYLTSTVGSDRATEFANGYSDVRIAFASNHDQNSGGQFVTTRTGLGLNTERFGPEVGIAEKIHNASLSGGEVFLIKFALGSTDLYDEWRSPSSGRVGWMYSNAMTFHRNMINKLKWIGYEPTIKAICWMQGEDDSSNNEQYSYYQQYEEALVNDLRSNFGSSIAFIDGGISSYSAWVHYVSINNAKQTLAANDPLHDYIQTIDGYTTTTEPSPTNDPYHYDSASMIKLGESFGDLVLNYLS